MKKYLLILLLCMTSLIGCSGSKETAPKNDVPELLKNADLSEHMEISIGFWNIQAMENATQKDGVWQYLEELLNITIKPVNLNWSDYNERYLIMGVSDTLPDIFAATTISGTSENNTLSLSDMLARGTLAPLPDDLSSYPKVQKIVNELETSLVQPDGKIYTFPRTSFENRKLSSCDAGILVRKDWMDNLGIKEPESLQEFIDMTVSFAKDDPDGNNMDDTIGYNVGSRPALGKWLILGISPECNVYTWVLRNGRYIPSYLLPEFETVIKAYRALYNEGGLDPEFYLKKTTDPIYDFARGKLGALEYKTSPSALAEVAAYWNQYHDNSEKFTDYVTTLPIFPSPDGNRYSNSSSSFWSETLFSSRVDHKKMERILYLYEYLLSNDGRNLTHFGLEHEDYELKDETYHCLLNTKEDNLSNLLLNKYPSLNLFSSLASWAGTDDDFITSEQNNTRYGKDIMKMSNDTLNWNFKNTIMVERPFDFLQMKKEESDIFSTTSLVDEFTKVIIGTEDPVTMWRDVIKRWNKEGFQEYIEKLNKIAESKLKQTNLKETEVDSE